MPVVLVCTKFDEFVTEVLRDMHGGDTQYALARANAQKVYEDSCRRLFHKAPSEVPAGVVSGTLITHTPCGGSTGQLTSLIILSESKLRRSSRQLG